MELGGNTTADGNEWGDSISDRDLSLRKRMSQYKNMSRTSLVTKLAGLNILICLLMIGIVSITAISFFDVKDSLTTLIDKEVAQMLCTAAHHHGHPTPYAPVPHNPKVVRWVGARRGNWMWTLRYGRALGKEYVFRFGHPHASAEVIEAVAHLGPRDGWLRSAFVQCMPEEYRARNAVVAYRNYYCAEKTFARWNHGRPPPAWWRNRT